MEACLNEYPAGRIIMDLPVGIIGKLKKQTGKNRMLNVMSLARKLQQIICTVRACFSGAAPLLLAGRKSADNPVAPAASEVLEASEVSAARNTSESGRPSVDSIVARNTSESGRPSVDSTAERLLDEYGNAILRMAFSYLHNMDDAEDILQDTLIRYLQTSPAFENRNHEKAWLLRVAANLSKNKIDYNKLREGDELDENLAAEEKEDLAFVWEAVKQLPVNYREVIHLFYEEGYSTAEIAHILNRKESSIRSDLRRGREKLKNILKEAYDFE